MMVSYKRGFKPQFIKLILVEESERPPFILLSSKHCIEIFCQAYALNRWVSMSASAPLETWSLLLRATQSQTQNTMSLSWQSRDSLLRSEHRIRICS